MSEKNKPVHGQGSLNGAVCLLSSDRIVFFLCVLQCDLSLGLKVNKTFLGEFHVYSVVLI